MFIDNSESVFQQMQSIRWIVIHAFLSIKEKFIDLVKALFLLVVLYLSFIYVLDNVDDYFYSNQREFSNFRVYINASFYLFSVIYFFVFSFIAIKVHRVLLPSVTLNVTSSNTMGTFESNLRYLVRAFWLFNGLILLSLPTVSLLIYLSSFSFAQLFENMSVFGWLKLIGSWLLLYIICPVFIVLPAIANKGSMNIVDAWKLGSEKRITLFFIIVIIPNIFFVFLMRFAKFESSEFSLGFSFLYSLLYVLIFTLEVALLSSAYAKFIAKK